MSYLDRDLILQVKGDSRLSDQVKRVMRDESGSVEAGLTLIPLTMLFLISAQLVFASQWGNMQQLRQQSETNRAAISGSTSLDSREVFQSNLGTHTQYLRAIPLLGGGQLII